MCIFFSIPYHTASDIREEGEDDVKSAWPLWVGLHTCYNGEHKGMQDGNMEQILNFRRSSDCSLQLENMKLESLVIVDQHATVNLYLSLLHTARHIMGTRFAQSLLEDSRHLCINTKMLNSFEFVTVDIVTDMKS